LGDNRWMAGLRNRPRSRAGELTCVTPKTMQQLPQHSLSAPGRHAFNFMADRWQQLQFGDIKFWHWIITAKGVDDTPNSPACRLLPPLTPRCPFIKSRTSPSPWPIINSAHSSGSLCMWNFHRGASSVGLIEEVALGPGAPRRGAQFQPDSVQLGSKPGTGFYFDLFATDNYHTLEPLYLVNTKEIITWKGIFIFFTQCQLCFFSGLVKVPAAFGG